ncbi:MAG: malectin domain-containing carbohydrate-binding protein [Bacteroidota bacterium]
MATDHLSHHQGKRHPILSYAGKLLLITLLCIASSVSAQNISFSNSNLNLNGLVNVGSSTFLQFGPDGRLYVVERYGNIFALQIQKLAANNYQVTAAETIGTVKNIPNHNDDGSSDGNNNREATSIYVAGTASNPVIYASSSDSRIGGPSGDKNLDTNSGVITRISWNGSSWETVDLVRGLPRSEENHASHGLEYVMIGGNPYLLLSQGGHTNAGSPSTNFAWITEYALSAAVLAIDLNALNALPILIDPVSGREYVYDLPTLDDPTRPNANGISDPNAPGYDGIDQNDPWGGNDGLNQAKLIPNGPVKMFSPGYRNTYDLVITESGAVYVTDNGANGGWGGYPENEGLGGTVTNNYRPGEPGSTSSDNGEDQVDNKDHLTLITTDIQNYTFGSFYGGHPNPVRANPSGAGLFTRGTHSSDPGDSNGNGFSDDWFRTQILPLTDPNFSTQSLPVDWPPVPVSSANVVEGDYRIPSKNNPDGPNDANVLIWQNNSNGIDEYTATAFGGQLKGNLIVGRNGGGNLHRIILNPDGSVNAYQENWISAIGGNALGVSCNGDNAPFPGTIWVATFNNQIKVFEPDAPVICILPGDPGYSANADNDSDGFSNQDELDNGTDLCSASSQPSDFDGDKVSDLNDLDDDADGIFDQNDPFQMGVPFSLPVINELFSDQLNLMGYQGLGLTGLMNNGAANPNYLNWLDDPAASSTDTDDIYGGAVGGMTIYHTTGDATTDDQAKGYQYGVNVDASTDTFVVSGRMLPPFHTHSATESQGVFIGNGFQDDYVKITLSGNMLTVEGENNGIPLGNLPSANIGTIPANLDLFFIIDPLNGTAQAAYSLDDGNTQINLGGPFSLGGAVLNAVQSNTDPLAVGMIGTADQDDGFASNWDFLNVREKNLGAGQVVRFRVNCAGPTIPAIDGGLDWISDIGATQATHQFSFNTGNPATFAANFWTGGVPSDIQNRTPFSIFDTERWDSESAPEMKYTFNVGQPGDYLVRLYMRNGWSGTINPGTRIFTVTVDGNSFPELVDIDLSADYGHKVATYFEVPLTTTDNLIDIEFIHYVQNPLICGIEILEGNCQPAGLSCDDNDPATFNDLTDGNCGCAGSIPTLSISSPLDGDSVTTDVAVSFAVNNWDIQTGGDHINYYLDGQSAGSHFSLSPILLNGLSSGPHQIELRLAQADNSEIGVLDAIGVIVKEPVPANGNIVFRVNAGGGDIAAIDGGPNWVSDINASSFSVNTGNVTGGTATAWDANVSAAIQNQTPFSIFSTERWDPPGAPEMQYSFDLGTPGDYVVRLFFRDAYSGTSTPGSRIFSVQVDGNVIPALTNLDLTATFGHKTAVAFDVPVNTPDALINIDFTHIVENPLISGIEIIRVLSCPPAGLVCDDGQNDTYNDLTDGNCGCSGTIPAISITDPAENASVTPDLDVSFTLTNWNPAPAGDYINYYVDGQLAGAHFASSPISLNGLTAGSHQIELRLVLADNTEIPVNDQISVDVIVPPTGPVWTSISNATEHIPRHENSLVQAGDRFYLFGGRESPRTLEVYDYTTNTWSTAASAPKDFNHFQATTWQGLIWVVCAFEDNGFPNETPESNIHMYDPAADVWIEGPEIPVARRRGGAGTVVYQDKFYVVGGNTIGHNGGYVSWFDVYDPIANTWTSLADAPHERDHFHAVVQGDKLYVIGGRQSGGPGGTFAPLIPQVDVYDFTSGSWSTLSTSADLPTPRAASGTVSFEGEIVIMGGEGNGQAYKTTEAFNPTTLQWRPLADMNHARHGTQAIVSGDGIHITSGSPNQGGGNQTNMEVYGTDNPNGQAIDASELSGPVSLDFANDGTQILQLQATNGDQGIFIRDIQINGPQAAEFGISSGYQDHFLLAANTTYDLNIQFAAAGNGARTASLIVEYSNNNSLSIPLNGQGGTPPPIGNVIGEVGRLSIDHNWTTVSLNNTYLDPVVIASVPSYNETDQATVRVRNVSNNGFEIRIEEWNCLDGVHVSETISYLVIESGVHTLLNGTTILAQNTDGVGLGWTNLTFPVTLASEPVTLGQVVTDNQPETVAVRFDEKKTNATKIRFKLNDVNANHSNETLSWIAMEAGLHAGTGVEQFEAVNTGKKVRDSWETILFQQTYGTNPLLIATIGSEVGGDQSSVRYQNLSGSGVQFFIEEENCSDPELKHFGEEVHFLLFDAAGNIEAQNNASRIAQITRSIEIYPNPLSRGGRLQIVLPPEINEQLSLEIVNVQGQTILTQEIDASRQSQPLISLPEVPSGIYLLRLQSEQWQHSASIVIE